MSAYRISLIALFLMAAMVMVVPRRANAQGLTVGTVATFDQPVEIPGRVLPAGTYEFVQSGSTIVKIWDRDQDKLVATLLTNEAEQSKFADRQEFEFTKGASDSPLELKAWFLDSGTIGHEFIYDHPKN